MSKEMIRLEIEAGVAELVLDRPEKRNALSVTMWGAIPDLVAAAVDDPAVKTLIIHGGTSGAFAAGADISEFETIYATEEAAEASGKIIGLALNAVEHCPKPVLAAIEGPCVGGGVSLAMAADLRVAADSARFGVTPARLGLVYPSGDTRRLVTAIGAARAKDLLFTGRIIPAQEAKDMGLVNRLVSDGQALAAARTFADEIAAQSQWSVRAIKRMIAGLEAGWHDDDAEAIELFKQGFANVDFQDGYRAFLEKRPARFSYK